MDDSGSILVVSGMEYVPQGNTYAFNGVTVGGSLIDGAGTEVVGVSLPNQVNVFDPDTGKQINTIVAPDVTAADGWATSVAVDDTGDTVLVGGQGSGPGGVGVQHLLGSETGGYPILWEVPTSRSAPPWA